MSSKLASRVISALTARSQMGSLLDQVAIHRRSFVIEKRGQPKAVLLGIEDYIRLAAPEPEILKAIGEASVRRGTSKLSSRRMDRIIQQARVSRKNVAPPVRH
jgi:prevent-host-death family protein